MNHTQMFNDSSIAQSYIEFLKDEKVKVVSFDIFDTVVYRTSQYPTDVFTVMGKEPLLLSLFDSAAVFSRYRIEAEKNARKKNSNREDISLNDIYREFNLSEEMQSRLINMELMYEDQFLYPNQFANEMISLAKHYQKRIIFLSDMYLSSEQIHKLALSKLAHEICLDDIFVSNEQNATKATGKLFELTLAKFQLFPENLLHIGDNLHSDFYVPQARNIKAIHFNNDLYLSEIHLRERAYLNQNIDYSNYRVQACLLNPYSDDLNRFYFNLGASLFGPVLWDFSHWLKNLYSQNNYSHILLMMREGRLFHKVLQQVAPELPTSFFYASRKSTFLLNLDPDNLNLSSLNYFNYRALSISDFYNHFKLSIINQDIVKWQHSTLERAQDIRINDRTLFESITEDLQNRLHEISNIIRKEQYTFLRYLESVGCDKESFLFDFGASGTAIKNIRQFLSRHDLSLKGSGMFYMHPSSYSSHLEYGTSTFLSTEEKDEKFIELLKRSPEIIEILFNGETSTTLSYENGAPILEKPSFVSDEIRMIIEAFDRGIETYIHTLQSNNITTPLYSADIHARILARLIEVPHPIEVKFLGALHHDEGCGSDQMHQLITQERINILKKSPLSEIYFQLTENLWTYQKEIPWIHGTITALDPYYLTTMLQLKSSNSINNPSIHAIIETLTFDSIFRGVIYGAGQFCLELIIELKKINFKIDYIVDTRALIQPFELEDYHVFSPSEIIPNLKNGESIIIASNMFVHDIEKTIFNYNTKLNIISVSKNNL